MIGNVVYRYCFEDIKLIENYEEAVNDKNEIWACHHKLETELDKTREELIKLKLYYKRPACELIFLKHGEHLRMHNKDKKFSEEHKAHMRHPKNETGNKKHPKTEEHRRHIREAQKGVKKPKNSIKYTWLTSEGEIRIMTKGRAHRYHKDWQILEKIQKG